MELHSYEVNSIRSFRLLKMLLRALGLSKRTAGWFLNGHEGDTMIEIRVKTLSILVTFQPYYRSR